MDKASDKIKEYLLIINARENVWLQKSISFDEVIILAFGSLQSGANTSYTVTFARGDESRPEGILVNGDSVKVKDGMRFNVTMTSRS